MVTEISGALCDEGGMLQGFKLTNQLYIAVQAVVSSDAS